MPNFDRISFDFISTVGEPCDDFGCSRCGFCWGNRTFYLECNDTNSRIIRNECDPGLWWNEFEKPLLGVAVAGVCDEWQNLPPSMQQKYQNDPNCVTPHCHWGQKDADRCTKKYWLSNDSGNVEHLECGGNLVWDNVKQQCILCENVLGCECR